MLLHWKVNLADQNKQQQQEDACLVPYMTYRYEKKTLIDTFQYCSTSRANQPLCSLANASFQNRGVCLQAFPSFPSPSPLFHFLALTLFLARSKPKIPFLGFFLLNGIACYAGYAFSVKSDKGSPRRPKGIKGVRQIPRAPSLVITKVKKSHKIAF